MLLLFYRGCTHDQYLFTDHREVLSKQKLHELVSEIDPKQVVDDDVEEVGGIMVG